MDILGIGNVLLDIFCFSEEDTALSLGLHPGSSVQVSSNRLDELLLAISAPIYVSGGAVSNTLKTAAALGFTCGAIGCIGQENGENDRWARIITADLAAYGVQKMLEERSIATGRRLILHMPGGVTSIAWAPGAAPTLRPEQIEADLVARTDMVYLDGSLLKNTAITDRIITLCKGFSVPLVIDMGAPETAAKRGLSIPEFFTRTDCILLVNNDEAFPLAVSLESIVPGDRGLQSATSFVDSIFSFFTTKKQQFPCIVRKEGHGGATAWQRGIRVHRDTQDVPHCIDKTSVGDVFSGAFMCAFLRNTPLSDALDFANTAARYALFVPGSRLDWNEFVALRDELPSL